MRARGLVCVPEAAKRLGIDPSTVREWIGKKRLIAQKIGGVWWLLNTSVAKHEVGA